MADNRQTQKKVKKAGNSWREGRVPLNFELPIELVEVLKPLAKKAGMSLAQFSSMLLEQQVMRNMDLEADIQKMVSRAFEEEFNRVFSASSPLLRSKIKKELAN